MVKEFFPLYTGLEDVLHCLDQGIGINMIFKYLKIALQEISHRIAMPVRMDIQFVNGVAVAACDVAATLRICVWRGRRAGIGPCFRRTEGSLA